jgi:hypothetical protein
MKNGIALIFNNRVCESECAEQACQIGGKLFADTARSTRSG